MKSYDMIASLGGNCSAAMQLKNRGLRREAYPLDWVYMEGEASIRYLCEAFKNRYSFEYAGGEWAFLDCVELRGLEKPKLRGRAKLIYKVWKSTSKWLNERGYKVKGIRF